MSSMQGSRGPTGGNLKGKVPRGYEQGTMQNFTPEQMQLFQQLFGNLGPDSFLSKLAGGDESMFQQMEAPAMRQFSALQGNLSSRFSGGGGAGSLGSRRSSGFQNTMNQAGSDFTSDLQSKRMGLQQQAIRDLMGMGNDLLNQRPYEHYLTQKQKPWWQELIGGVAGGLSGGIGSLIGNLF